MKKFIEKYQDLLIGVLSGFDRLVLRGVLQYLSRTCGMGDYLNHKGILLKDFSDFCSGVSERLKKASIAEAKRINRPIRYLPSSKLSKEDKAREIMETDNITDGLICVLTSLEQCRSFEIYRDKQQKRLSLRACWRKCLHLYHYWIDPEFGFMNARIQSWFPFNIQVCLNGREWLSRLLDKVGLEYLRSDNCFLNIKDMKYAQKLMDNQLKLNWPMTLKPIVYRLNPIFNEIFDVFKISYYWTVYQSEWATDILFKSKSSLKSIYPQLITNAISIFGSPDVLRFLGRKGLAGNFKGEVTSDYKKRHEGVRVKHQVKGNSVKMYDKKGSILRVETTINNLNNHRDLKIFQERTGDDKPAWRPMRKGISDLYRRTQFSQACNNRYLDALAATETDQKLYDLINPVCQAVKYKGKPVRGLRPWSKQDRQLLNAVARAEFFIVGFRNRDIMEIINPEIIASGQLKERKRAAARITRKIRMLRAHGIIRKIPKTHRYVITAKGNKIIAAILKYQECTLQQVNRIAA